MRKLIQKLFGTTPVRVEGEYTGRVEHRVLSCEQLLSGYQEELAEIKQLSGIPNIHFESLYLAPLQSVASYVQLLPASEAHHHAYPGGMMDHLIEIVVIALKLRRTQILPPGIDPEEIELRKDVWTYVIFIAALTHDIGKAVVDTTFYTDKKQWSPLTESGPVKSYSYDYNPDRKHKFHEKIPLLVLHKFVPMSHLQWVQDKDPEAFESLICFLSGDYENAGALGDIVQKADQHSVIENIGGKVEVAADKAVKSLHENLLRYLRKILHETESLSVNRKGAACFTTDDAAYFVSKRTLDAIKEAMRQDGQSVPGRNDRLMDEMQQFKIIVPYEDKAIWKCNIKIGDWSQNFSMLRFPIEKVWPKLSDRPENPEGIVVTPLDLNDEPIIDSPEDAVVEPVKAAENVAPSKPVKPLVKPKVKVSEPEVEDLSKGVEADEISGLEALMEEMNEPGMDVSAVAEEDLSGFNDDAYDYDDTALDIEIESDVRADFEETVTIKKEAVVEIKSEQNSKEFIDSVAEKIISGQKSSVDYHNNMVHQAAGELIEFDNPSSHAARFIKWLVEGVKAGRIPINQPANKVHLVEEGLFLVSPSIFRQYESENINTAWQKAQRELTKKKINEKTATGENIFEYEIMTKTGRNKSSSIKGILIPNPGPRLGLVISEVNPSLRKKA